MEEEIKRVKRFENIEGAIKVYKEFRRFKNDGWIENIDPDYFFNLVDYILANSIPTSVIQNILKEIDNRNYNDYTNNQDGNEVKNNILKDIQKLLEEGRNNK